MTNNYNSKSLKSFEVGQNKLLFFFCLFIAILLTASLFFKYFVYLAFVLCALVILFSKTNQIFKLLLFLFPFALIFKVSPNTTSLFTFLELFAIVILLIRLKNIKPNIFILISLLFVFCLISFGSLLQITKLLIIVVLYWLFVENYDTNESKFYLPFIILGLLFTTVLGSFKEEIPRFLSFYSDLNYEWIDGTKTIRFSGVFNDPNYFSVAIIQVLIVSILFWLQGGIQGGKKKLLLISIVVLLSCGLLTISKSFYLILLAVIFIIAFNNMRKHFFPVIIFLSVLIAIVVLNPNGILDQILYRFNAYDVTTGRAVIWARYLEVINSSLKNTLIGAGLGAPYVVRPAHSIYIEALYYMGTLGLLLFTIIMTYISCYKKTHFRRRLVNYLGFICLAFQYAFLCGITGYEVTFYLMISYMIFNNDWSSNSNKEKKWGEKL